MVVWVLFKKSLVFDQTFFCIFTLSGRSDKQETKNQMPNG
jgi:hypothetical protein